MAAFVAKQMMGNLGGGGGDDAESVKEKEEEAERERLEAIKEAEERRKDKHRKMEEEREKMRQDIRDKYKIEKKVEAVEETKMEPDNPLMRKKKTPEELAKEAEEADLDDLTKLKNTLETQMNEIKTQIEGKCVIQWGRLGCQSKSKTTINQHQPTTKNEPVISVCYSFVICLVIGPASDLFLFLWLSLSFSVFLCLSLSFFLSFFFLLSRYHSVILSIFNKKKKNRRKEKKRKENT